MIAKFWGTRGSSRASFVLMTLLPSKRNVGRSEGRPPVAMIASVNVTQSEPSAFRISRSFGPMKDAWPESTSTRLPLHNWPTPFTSRWTTDVFHCCNLAKSTLTGPVDAAFPRALDRMNQVPGVDERLARNASVVQAFAAEPVPFHEEDALPQLRRSDGGRITAGPRTDDDEVDVPVHGPTERLRSLNPFANRDPVQGSP